MSNDTWKTTNHAIEEHAEFDSLVGKYWDIFMDDMREKYPEEEYGSIDEWNESELDEMFYIWLRE